MHTHLAATLLILALIGGVIGWLLTRSVVTALVGVVFVPFIYWSAVGVGARRTDRKK